MKHFLRNCVGLVAFVLMVGLALGQGKDSLLGNWVLDRGKSILRAGYGALEPVAFL